MRNLGLILWGLSAAFVTFGQKNIIEIPVYQPLKGKTRCVLYMPYAQSQIQNPQDWENKELTKKIYEIDLVFTLYPKRKEDWITNYDLLLNKRIEALKALAPELAQDTSVRWNYILQTSCTSDSAARKMFHGAVFKYKYVNGYKPITSLTDTLSNGGRKTWEEIQAEVEDIAKGLSGFPDSTVFEVMQRQAFKDMLVITDWTGSMYPYGAQVLLWQKLHEEDNRIKGYIFFNDGNRKYDFQKRIGSTGGVFYTPAGSMDKVIRLTGTVARMGSGGDIPENNLEAVYQGMRVCKGYQDIVMIADNRAPVRDMRLLPRMTKPVHIILCGADSLHPIHPHYLEIARKSGGSLHTMEMDLTELPQLKEGQTLEILGVKYKLKKGSLIRLPRTP